MVGLDGEDSGSIKESDDEKSKHGEEGAISAGGGASAQQGQQINSAAANLV